MANTLTAIMPKILAKGLLALREQAIMPRLVNGDYSAEAAQKGDTIDVPIPSSLTVSNVAPGNTPPAPADSTPDKVQIVLNNWKKVNFHLTDKQLVEIDRNQHFYPMQLSEAIRALANEVNSSIHDEYKLVYGYTGTAATTPFATTVADAVNARKILHQQKAPRDFRRGVLDFSAEANALALAQFSDAEKVGSAQVKIEGEIGRKFGIDWFADDQVKTHTTNATGAGALTVNGVHAIGVKTLSVAKGAGANWNALKGDIISIAGDPQTYVITADVTVVQATNTNVSIEPGLKKATVGAEVITVRATHVVNLAFHRDAFAFANRPLAQSVGDLELGSRILSMTDPQTGISLRLEISRQYKQVVWEFDLLWGVKLVRPELAMRIAG